MKKTVLAIALAVATMPFTFAAQAPATPATTNPKANTTATTKKTKKVKKTKNSTTTPSNAAAQSGATAPKK